MALFSRRRRATESSPAPALRVDLGEPRALLALVPEPEQSASIRDALRTVGVPYTIPVRITLQTGLDVRDEDEWRGIVREITRSHDPFTVRMVGPEVIQDRSVCLRVVGQAAQRLQDELHQALGFQGFAPDDPRWTVGPVLPLAGTWTGLTRVELHELATGVRDELRAPVEFRATTLYAFEDSVDEDVPFIEFPLGFR